MIDKFKNSPNFNKYVAVVAGLGIAAIGFAAVAEKHDERLRDIQYKNSQDVKQEYHPEDD